MTRTALPVIKVESNNRLVKTHRGGWVAVTTQFVAEPLVVGGRDPMDLAVEDVKVGESIRSDGLDDFHVKLLMETDGAWPSIVVWVGSTCSSTGPTGSRRPAGWATAG